MSYYSLTELVDTPFAREAELIDTLRGAGSTETEVAAVIGAARLLSGIDNGLSPAIRTTIAKALFGDRPPVRKARKPRPVVGNSRQPITLDQKFDRILKDAEDLQASTDRVLERPVDDAYNRIELAASRIVEKSGLSHDAAVVRAMERNPELYDAYTDALSSRFVEEAEAEQRVRRADLAAWEAEQAQ